MITQATFYGAATPMQDGDYLEAAKFLNVEPAAIQAVTVVESNGKPFLQDGRPDILFEAHLFGRHTGNRYASKTDPNGKAISATKWDRTLYGAAKAWQYTRLYTAMQYDVEAAVKSTSFGAFQILGQEYKAAGFTTLEDFVRAMANSAGDHLKAFCNYVKTNKIDDELRDKRWTAFARAYNGPAYAQNDYDNKMAREYQKLAASWATKRYEVRDDDNVTDFNSRAIVAAVQAALNATPGMPVSLKCDGWTGPNTDAAIMAYEQSVGLRADGKIDEALLNSLGIALPG